MFPDKKVDGKGKSSHKPSEKNRSKTEHGRRSSSAIPEADELTIADGVPHDFGFLYEIDELEINSDDPDRGLRRPGSSAIKNDKALYWCPPNRTSGFHRTRGRLYRWKMGQTTLVGQNEKVSDATVYSTTSVCFQARQDNFLATKVDCSQVDVISLAPDPGWCQIMFHSNKERPNMSEVDFIAGMGGLVAPANGLTWMPQVLPEVYNYDTKSPNSKRRRPPQNDGLCGKLGIIFGMAAFSVPVAQAEDVVAQCFKFGKWEKQPFDVKDGDGRYQDRGVVITIFLDPTAKAITRKHLKAFEDGKYGPIFEGHSRDYVSQPSSTPQHSLSSTVSGYSNLSTPRSSNPPAGLGLAVQGSQGSQAFGSRFSGSPVSHYVRTAGQSDLQNYGALPAAGPSYSNLLHTPQQYMGDEYDEEDEEPDAYDSGSQYQDEGEGKGKEREH